MRDIGIWLIAAAGIVGVLFRPWKLPEWIWAVGGATLLVAGRLMPLHAALDAVKDGFDVYLFLLGMMLLSEQARTEGLFDWLAGWAVSHSKESSRRLFLLIYSAGVCVTLFLSNDATAVVLTPAVYAAVKKAGAKPTPYLIACAFIANAASFALPISNPANLVVFDGHMPKIMTWIQIFGLASLASIVATLAVLLMWFRVPLRLGLSRSPDSDKPVLSQSGKWTAFGLVATVAVLMIASSLDLNLGFPTFVTAAATVCCISLRKRQYPRDALRQLAWGVVPLVAGLFVIVAAMSRAGALRITRSFFEFANDINGPWGKQLAAFGVGIASNIINNLPVGLLSGLAVHHPGISGAVRNSILIGVDLGPNLTVTGSLATLLWLIALRREGEPTSGWVFFRVGLVAMPCALVLAIFAL